MDPAQPDLTSRPSRPVVVKVIILLFIIETLGLLLVTLIYLAAAGLFSSQVAATVSMQLPETDLLPVEILATTNSLQLLAYTATTIGLIKMRPWAWTAAMVLIGIRLAFGLVDYLFDNPAFMLLAFAVLTVFLLNQRVVRTAYGVTKESRAPVTQR